ncbi:Tat pathway signal sequence domain protein [Streptomyces sp. NPDC005474]|uniref:Tat pathway signal sequence domain protein n=1 Tax=Streptomyces sp. NPDC005474 TaxID=3154878 RepID=UPI0034535FDE
MDAYPDHGALSLTQSYTDQAGLFSTAFTYDNALAILAHLATRTDTGRRRAVALGDSLLYAQAHDPAYDDGRLRQAYNVGPYVFFDGVAQPDGFVRADGTANVGTQFGFTGTAVGDMAWAGIALAALARRTGKRRFLDGAIRIGTWIEVNGGTDQPLGGYRFGVDGANAKLPFSSTEHNTDLVALFGQLALLTGDPVWRRRRATARAFVEKMWEPAGTSGAGFFYTGTNDGVTINKSPVPEDAQTWTHLALGSRRHSRSLDWAAAELAVLDRSDRPNSTVPAGQSYEGVTFSSASPLANEDAPIAEFQPRPDRNGVWFEGTAHLALGSRRHSRSLDWAAAELAVLDRSDRPNSTVPAGQSYEGVTFSSASPLANEDAPIAEFQPRPDRNGVWFEGTAHLALALRDRAGHGDEARAHRLVASIERAQELLGTGQTVGSRALPERAGVVSASSPLDTGFGFGYYPYRHTGATAWYLLAATRTNPLKA